ncbi:metallophosphoesterase [Pontibacter beigongshangensis]|uniref:metallophosphoesterase n=1 Tax=Pontibacter beigongshangensis TaxID=2574733 RepID=UPI00164FF63E|nr:metallophosphoesterase [Pontibacter beigongshangensis]
MARYALTDIHGCASTLKAMVTQQLRLRKDDELYILGDLVNKGPDSKGVIDYIIHLRKQHYQLKCLRGNHDQMLLQAARTGESALKLPQEEKEMLLTNFGIKDITHLPDRYFNFLGSLPFYLELPDYFLVHAGFDFKHDDIFRDTDAMMNIRNYKVDWSKVSNKRLLHGHTPTALHAIKKAVAHEEPQINLDAGCVYYKNAAFGNLVALDLDSYALFVQSNVDRPYLNGRK